MCAMIKGPLLLLWAREQKLLQITMTPEPYIASWKNLHVTASAMRDVNGRLLICDNAQLKIWEEHFITISKLIARTEVPPLAIEMAGFAGLLIELLMLLFTAATSSLTDSWTLRSSP